MTGYVIIFVWLACGIGAAGFAVAYFQGSFPTLAKEYYREDLGIALMLALFGPVALVMTFFLSGFGKHGWRLRRRQRKAE